MKDKQAVIRARRARRAPGDGSPRERLLQAAFAVFREHGFADAGTLEIATRAQVSKRDLYALFDSKLAMLAACITERAGRMRQPLNLAAQVPESREALEATLVQFGKSVLHGLSDPDVLAVYRLAIAESARAPDIAQTLDKAGRRANHLALGAWLAKAQAHGLIGAGNPAAMAAHFLATLGGALLIQLLLRVRDAPTAGEIESRARTATEALILLYPPPCRGDWTEQDEPVPFAAPNPCRRGNPQGGRPYRPLEEVDEPRSRSSSAFGHVSRVPPELGGA